MKLAKKLLALALAGVLALSVLTGCGDSDAATAKNIADAMNGISKGFGSAAGVSFSEGDATAKMNAKKGAEYLSTVEGNAFSVVTGNEDLAETLMVNTAKAMGYCTEGNQDTEYLYLTCFEKESKMSTAEQAAKILFAAVNSSSNSNVNKDYIEDAENKQRDTDWKVSIADFTGKDGKRYRLGVITVKAVPRQG